MVEQPPRHERRAEEHGGPEEEVDHTLGGHPQHHDEEGEEQQRRAEVALGDHHEHGECPRRQDRQHGPGFGEVERADLPRPAGDQLAIIGEIAGEEDGEGQLGELAGLEVDRPDAHPDAGAGERAADTGDEREHEQGDADEQERPAIAGEVGWPLDDRQGEHEGDDGDDAPRRLQPRKALRLEASDHHVADAVKQGDEGEQRRIGTAGEPAHGEVGEQE